MRYRIRMICDGEVVAKEVHGDSEDAVRGQLSAAGHVVLGVRRLKGRAARFRRSGFSLTLFLQELSTLLEAGLVLTEALEALRDKSDANQAVHHIIDGLVATMYDGRSLSQALERYPDVFPSLLVATVACAEGGGQLHVVLKRYQEYEAKLEVIRKRVISALIYPAVVVSVGICVLLFMAFFIVPRFAAVFETVSPRTGSVEAMLWWSTLLQENGMAVFAALVGLVACVVIGVRSVAFRQALGRLLRKVPKVREITKLFALTRFFRTVGLLVSGGTPVILALRLSRGVLPVHMHPQLAAAISELEAGLPIATVLHGHGLTTPVAERLLRVGEQSGNLGSMCEYAAQFHDGTLDRAVEWLSKVCEPVLMLVVGATVGAALIMLYMPIFGLADSIG
ncbi:type II secretion system F family protein [Achromobacter xylosoxidans]